MASKSTEMNNSQAKEKPVQYALVTFLIDGVSKVVPIKLITVDRNQLQNFNPSNCSDFDLKQKYYVKWYYCTEEGDNCESTECYHEFDIYSAFIKYLGGKS